jgi:hypothetical protein
MIAAAIPPERTDVAGRPNSMENIAEFIDAVHWFALAGHRGQSAPIPSDAAVAEPHGLR